MFALGFAAFLLVRRMVPGLPGAGATFGLFFHNRSVISDGQNPNSLKLINMADAGPPKRIGSQGVSKSWQKGQDVPRTVNGTSDSSGIYETLRRGRSHSQPG